MSFWPRLRRRSRVRKRSSAKPNPYANIGLDKLAIVHAEFDAQRALFAAEKGVPVSVVRFVTGSPHGWTLLPRSAVNPSPEGEDNRSSVTSTASSSPGRGSVEVPASPRHPLQRTSSSESVSEETPGGPEIPDSSGVKAEAPPSNSPLITVNAGRSNLTELQSLNTEGQVVLAHKDQEWNKLTRSSLALLVSLRVFSTALGFNTVFALIVSGWNRGKSSFKRVFSHLAIHLLSAVRSSLQLQEQSSSLVSGTSVLSSEEAEMKVTRATPIPPVLAKEADAGGRQSSFTFPVLTRDSSVGTPIFRVQQDLPLSQGQSVGASPALGPVVTSVKVVAVSSQPGSPAFDGSRGCQKPCQKLKSRIFKCHPPRKVTPATSENSSAEEDAADGEGEVEPPIEGSGIDSPPRSSESPRCKTLSFMKRRSKSSKKGTETDDQLSGHSTTESELEDVSTSPVTRLVTVKAAKSSEVLASRNPNSDSAPEAGKKLSRSQELKLSFKKLKRRYKSQEISLAAANHLMYQGLALESATVKELDELAFPFNHETDPSNCSTPTTPGPKADKKKSGEGIVPSTKSTTTRCRLGKSVTSPVSRMASDKNTIVDYRPELRKLKTTSPRVPLPADHGELARSTVLDRETLGALLILAVLSFLLLGKIPAILGTACLCLILSHIQRFMSSNMTPAQRERLASRNVGVVGLSRLGETSPPHSHGQGGPAVDLQSSEYRKKVLIEGFLDRGNRKTA